MKVEINRMSSNPANDMLEVYASNTRPVAQIEADDFAEILSERQLCNYLSGETKFNVNENDLMEASKKYFPHNK